MTEGYIVIRFLWNKTTLETLAENRQLGEAQSVALFKVSMSVCCWSRQDKPVGTQPVSPTGMFVILVFPFFFSLWAGPRGWGRSRTELVPLALVHPHAKCWLPQPSLWLFQLLYCLKFGIPLINSYLDTNLKVHTSLKSRFASLGVVRRKKHNQKGSVEEWDC